MDVTAVDGVDLTVRRGEVFGLLGPNGAGKSTTVEILQGNRSRDAGEVSVLGADPATGTRAWRSRVGIVRQDESAPAELTVRETVRGSRRSRAVELKVDDRTAAVTSAMRHGLLDP